VNNSRNSTRNNTRKPVRTNKNEAVQIQGLSVEVRNNDINKALRRFKKMIQEDGLLQRVREKEYYEKPTSIRKRAKAAARSRHLKSLKKTEEK
jgi:small subunit ribosomal protein S21